MKKIKLVLALTALSLAPQLSQAGPVWAANGHEYEFVNAEGITWVNANAAAILAGWYLATVTSVEEHNFIVASVLSAAIARDRSHYWIGGNDVEQEGTYRWANGEAWGYTNWWNGEPNNLGAEDYVAYDFRGGWAWNDAPNDLGAIYGFSRGYLRERNAGPSVPEPESLALLGLGLLGAGLARRRRA